MINEGVPTQVEPNQAAILFGPEGISVLFPGMITEDFQDEVPVYVMAAMEALFRAQEEGVEALAAAFGRRVRY